MELIKNLERGEALRTSRRRFFAIGGAAVLLAACDSDDNGGGSADVTLDFSNDVGVLNYAYALEQLEAAFYTRVMASPYSGMTSEETQILGDLKAHEVIHRDFFKKAIEGAGATALPDLEVDFSSINFSNRASVLGAAKTFEDLGVAAYNGAGVYISNADYLTIAGKIVSVEARHAAAIRDLLNPFSDDFSDNADSKGLDGAMKPKDVIAAASKYIKATIRTRNT